MPFLVSAILVAIGLYLRVSLEDTPAFRVAAAREERVAVPLGEVVRGHWLSLIQGSLSIVVCYALFYIATVYMLGYGVKALAIPRTSFLERLCVAIMFMAAMTPISAALADRFGRRPVLLTSAVLAGAVGLAMPALLAQGSAGVLAFLCSALGVMGLTFAPLGALLPELFPTHVRYTGAASTYNLGGILGASLAPSLAQVLKRAAASRRSAPISPSPPSSAFSLSSPCAKPGATRRCETPLRASAASAIPPLSAQGRFDRRRAFASGRTAGARVRSWRNW